MGRVGCGSAAAERPERTARGYRRFRCRRRGEQFNERSAGALKRARCTSGAIALVVLWRLGCRLTLRDLSEMFLLRGIVSSHEALREWEAKLTPSFPRNSGSVAVGLVVPAVAPGSWKRLGPVLRSGVPKVYRE